MNIAELKRKAIESESKGDYKKALSIYQTILKEKPDDPDILLRVGQILLRFKQDKKAGEFLLKAVQIFEEREIANNRVVAIYKKLLQIFPEKKELYKKLAEAFYSVGMVGEAGKALETYIEYLFKNGEYDKGFENYELLLTWQPENFALKERVADIYLAFKKKDRAIELLGELLSYYSKRNKVKEEVIKQKLFSLGVKEEELGELISSDHEEEEKDSVFVTLDDLIGGKKTLKRPSRAPPKKEEKAPVAEEEPSFEPSEVPEMTEAVPVEEEEKIEEEVEVKEEEEKKAEEVSEEEISSPQKMKGVAETLLLLGDYTGALDSYYTAYQLYLKENSLIEAYKILKEIADKWPEEIRARKEMVRISHMLKNKEMLVDSILSLAECLYKRGAKEEAVKWFLKVLQIEPDNKKAKEYVSIIAPEKLKELKKPKVETPRKEPEVKKVKKEVKK